LNNVKSLQSDSHTTCLTPEARGPHTHCWPDGSCFEEEKNLFPCQELSSSLIVQPAALTLKGFIMSPFQLVLLGHFSFCPALRWFSTKRLHPPSEIQYYWIVHCSHHLPPL